jgi:carbonic anhydrase
MSSEITRREILAGLGVTAVGQVLNPGVAEAAPSQEAERPPANADEALRLLMEGNQRFVSGKLRYPHTGTAWRQQLRREQHPFATILGCSDSRVPPEMLFDRGFGDLFVIRVAGNVIATDVLGSIQYAAMHLRTPLLLIMGHEGCGAVTAALQAMADREKEGRHIQALVKLIEPGLKGLRPALKGAERVRAAVEANVRWSLKQLADMPEARKAMQDKRFRMAGGVYELETGKVRILS